MPDRMHGAMLYSSGIHWEPSDRGRSDHDVKKRIDTLLVDRGLAPSREKARALLMAGEVLVSGRPVTKPGVTVPEDAPLVLKERLPYVGRGGIKLAHALDALGLSVEGATTLDVGASTGGFTDCMLQRGVRRVYAVDVGRGQLDHRLRQDPRVVGMERVNARHPFPLPEPVDLATVDVSFISLRLVLPEVARHLRPNSPVLALVKPQFEAERGEVGRGGVVRDARVHARVLGRFLLWAIAAGFRIRGLTPSPIVGDAGNREFFVMLVPPGG